MAPLLPGYSGSYGLPHPGQVMMMPIGPAVVMGTEYEPSAMGGEGYQEDWGYSMPAVPPASDQFPVHLGPNTVEGFWHQVRCPAHILKQSGCVSARWSEGLSLRMLPELTERATWAAGCQMWPLPQCSELLLGPGTLPSPCLSDMSMSLPLGVKGVQKVASTHQQLCPRIRLHDLPLQGPCCALQVNMQGGYQAYTGAWVPAEQAYNNSVYVPYSYSMPADEPQYHGGKFQQWQAPGGRPRDTIKAHEGARGEGI